MELEKIRELASRVASTLGYEVVDLQHYYGKKGNRHRFNFLIDHGPQFTPPPESKSSQESLADSFITLDDCFRFSKELELELDLADQKGLLGPLNFYTLEVSSPGVNRPLVLDAHFLKFIGREVEIQLVTEKILPDGTSRKKLKGVLKDRTGEFTTLEIEEKGKSLEIDLQNFQIKKTHLIPRLPW